jgi:2'-5' RNA ligase
MGYAIEMFFDSVSESRVFSLWDGVARFGAPSMRNGDSRPHVSLAVADSVDQSAMRELLDSLAGTVKSFPLSLASLGLFASSERVPYLAPQVTPELLAFRERFFDHFSAVARGVWRYYAPTAWMPHCTLAMGVSLEQLGPAFDACQSFGLPLACTVSEIGLAEFSPVKHLHVVSLAE